MEIFGIDIDLNRNQAKKMRLENLISDPTVNGENDAGLIYFNNGDDYPRIWTGTKWLLLGLTTVGGGATYTVTQYRDSYEADAKFYQGYLKDTTIVITRTDVDGIIETAQGLTDLATDWTNRLTLTYI